MWVATAIVGLLSAIFLITGCVPRRGSLIRRREQPRLFWIVWGLWAVLLFVLLYLSVYWSLPPFDPYK